ncbi:hypothetical protein QP519_09780 [Weeksella virosa]|uniref:hypothetical protein n=1 Tax=Weeksella virosa TaxID=1014 RepID=UPI002556FAAD|nr:hypothetical protein [Weeksella virosa]MDK7375824.1 hypothetical protein [Weeksella virosa]
MISPIASPIAKKQAFSDIMQIRLKGILQAFKRHLIRGRLQGKGTHNATYRSNKKQNAQI